MMLRSIDKWGVGYLRSIGRRARSIRGTRHLMFCVADHFEPYRGGVSDDVALERLKPWCDNYMKAVDSFRDADGRTPRHTFFYPQEEYNEKALDMLGDLCRKGAGEVEIHLHHRNDTADGLMEKLVSFRDILHKQHGMLGKRISRRGAEGAEEERVEAEGENAPVFAFVHGNWALCNSRPDGDWCGVNEELGVLAEAGCYADFTFPSAPSPTQPRMVNAIYRAKDVPGKSRSADYGVLSEVWGEDPSTSLRMTTSDGVMPSMSRHLADELMLISGPLALNWKRRKFGVLPRLENAEIAENNPATADRVDLWAKQGIHVQGRPEWVFVKTHTHGCVAENASLFLNAIHDQLQRYNDGVDWCLHYVTAREMFNIIRAAEDGKTGNPGDYRDYEVTAPRF